MTPPTSEPAAPKQRGLLWHHYDFRWFWAGQSISVLGTQVTSIALPLVAALTLDTGAGGVSVIATASFLPNVLLPLVPLAWAVDLLSLPPAPDEPARSRRQREPVRSAAR